MHYLYRFGIGLTAAMFDELLYKFPRGKIIRLFNPYVRNVIRDKRKKILIARETLTNII